MKLKRQIIFTVTEEIMTNKEGMVSVQYKKVGHFEKKENISHFIEGLKKAIEEWPCRRKGDGVEVTSGFCMIKKPFEGKMNEHQ